MAAQMASLGQQKRTLKEKTIWEHWARFLTVSLCHYGSRAQLQGPTGLKCISQLWWRTLHFWFDTVLKRMISVRIYQPIGMKYILLKKGLTSDLKCTLQQRGLYEICPKAGAMQRLKYSNRYQCRLCEDEEQSQGTGLHTQLHLVNTTL